MLRSSPYLLLVLAACERPPVRHGPSLGRDSADSAFTLVQARGHTAMGVDQYTSVHRFESLADGGRISLQRHPGDALAAIHEFLAFQRHDHRAGNGASH